MEVPQPVCDNDTRVCQSGKCSKQLKPISEFPFRVRDTKHGRKGERGNICQKCMDTDRTRKRKKTKAMSQTTWEDMEVETFLTKLGACDTADIDVQARVNFDELVPVDLDNESRARAIALICDEVMSLHWTFTVKDDYSKHTEWSFCCAQSKDREKKPKARHEDTKERATRRMDRDYCHGWLRVRVKTDVSIVEISVLHQHSHLPYEDISLPEKWKEFIRSNLKMSPTKLWQEILSTQAGRDVGKIHLPYRQKAVYYYWHQQVQDQWRFTDEPFESAKNFIKNAEDECVAILQDIEEPLGIRAFAFQATDIMREWASKTQEIAIDSTWNTNRDNFELFAVVADANGVGVPLSYLLIQTSKEANKGAKEQVLVSWFESLKNHGVYPEFVLTDKDWSEINAARKVWSNSKHQLCFWHALKALKTRLSQNRSMPTKYNAEEAHQMFNDIDVNFVPERQYYSDKERPLPPPKPLQRIHFLYNGCPSVITQPKNTNKDYADEESDEESYWRNKEKQNSNVDEEDIDDGEDRTFDDDDVLQLIEECISDPIDEASESAPEETAGKSKNPSYTFCPPSHRLAVLRLFAKHHSWHSLLPERHRKSRSSEEIYHDAVTEMYTHCKRNNLYEVWAYCWNSWYSPERWKLWARSAYSMAISHKRTTMMVEGVWKNIKCVSLRFNNRPRTDYVVYVIVCESLPTYRTSFANAAGLLRNGRPQNLTSEQKSLKNAWLKLSVKPIKGSYSTDSIKWLCSCGAQKYHAHLLCKHLVQAVPMPSNNWWPIALRQQTPPFYNLGATSLPQITPYGWVHRMPGLLPTSLVMKLVPANPKTPSRRVGGPLLTANRPSPSQISSPIFIESSPLHARSHHSEDDSLKNGVETGFQPKMAVDQFTELQQGLLDALAILNNQGKENIDPRFLDTMSNKFKSGLNFVKEINHLETRRARVATNGVNGLVSKGLVGYRFK